MANTEENHAKDRRGDSINIVREIYCEESFTQAFASCQPVEEDRRTLFRKVLKRICKHECSVTCFLYSIFPILNWLPKYECKKNLFPDVTGGFTVLIMHVPQGMYVLFLIIESCIIFCRLYFVILLCVTYGIHAQSK